MNALDVARLEQIGYELRSARKQSRLTQAEVARFVGVSQPYWSLIEKGAANITVVQLLRALRVIYHTPSSKFFECIVSAVRNEGIAS